MGGRGIRLYNTLPYDPFKDFFGDLRTRGLAACVRGQSRPRPEDDEGFRRAGEIKPGEVQCLDAAIGTTPQLQAEVLKQREGLQGMATVVFAGGGDALQALIGGTVQLSSGVLAPAHPHIKAGKILGLAVTGTARWHDLPEIPTMVEAGYKDFVFDTYTALMAPVKTPPEIVRQLEKVALEILNRPEMRAKLTQSGFDVTARDGKGHMARVAKEVPMFRDIITQAGINKLLGVATPEVSQTKIVFTVRNSISARTCA